MGYQRKQLCRSPGAHGTQQFNARPCPHAYLISSTLSATSIHIDERKRTRHDSPYVAYKKKKITTCCAVTKRRSRTKAAARISLLAIGGEREKKQKIKTKLDHWCVLCRQKARERCHVLRLVWPGPLLLTSLAPLNAPNQQDTPTWEERSAPPAARPNHTEDIGFQLLLVFFFNSLVFCLFVCFTWRSPQTQTGAPSVKAGGGGGGAASSTRLKLEPHGRTPSYCCSHSAAFAEQCVTPFTYKLRISPWKAWAGLLSLRVGSKQQVYQFKEGKHCFSLFKK